MRSFPISRGADGRPRLEISQRANELLTHPLFNKGSAFTAEERRAFDLDGLLPDRVFPQELQAKRVYGHIMRKTEPLERYIGLAALQERNEHLFYRILLDHLEEFLPIVYTPTVGEASREYSHIFRRGRGLWITPAHRGRIEQVLENAPYSGVRLCVVTDNQAILGIGDQGAGGMVIPIGKLAIYSAAAGIHPAETLPVSLDVGTDNEQLLGDELYMGWRERRLTGEAYDSLVEEFVEAMGTVFPGALIQWEDFKKSIAFALLERYRGRCLSFNDDIQGTGATALAGLLAAARLSGVPLTEQRVVIVGGGAAGIGIAHQLRAAFASAGLAGDDLTRSLAVLDSQGLIVDDRERLDAYKRALAWPAALAAASGLGEDRSLPRVVGALEPTVLLGTSGQPGLFDEALVRSMASGVERPVIFPFSNPTHLSEARPEDLIRWTGGRALVASGSPFPPFTFEGKEFAFGQGNNAFIFPGVGLGALVAEATTVSEGMFTAAAEALAQSVSDEELERGRLYPRVARLRAVTARVAAAVVAQAMQEGLGTEIDAGRIDTLVAESMWTPDYPEMTPV